MRYADMIKGHVVASLLFYPKGQKRERDRWHQKERHKQKSSNNMRNRQKAKGRQGTAVAAAYLRAYEYAWAWVHCTAGTRMFSSLPKEGMEKQAYWQWQACAIPCSDF
jgi:hypothetical protein